MIRIANCSGFYGDRFDALHEMLLDGPVDVVTGDYLAELTMLLLWRGQSRDGTGYAKTFLRQLERDLGHVAAQKVKIVVNAGGLAPAAMAAAVREMAANAGVDLRVAHIEGDDLLPLLDDLQAAGNRLAHLDTGRELAELGLAPLTANAYLGAWGIAQALEDGADVVICPRVTDASLVVGPAAWRHAWGRSDWDALAGAVVAGHVIECGTQATGGNYPFFQGIEGLEHPGFPIAEVEADGSSVITKHEGTGGRVTVGTVTAQLLYEIGGARYLNPDVTTRFDTIRLTEESTDRVRISGVRGEPPTTSLKVCINALGGFRNEMTFVLTGLDIEAKAALVRRTLPHVLRDDATVETQLLRFDHLGAERNAEAVAHLRVIARAPSPDAVSKRAFAAPLVELALGTYPGCTFTTPPRDAEPFGEYWPALVDKGVVGEAVVAHDGTRTTIPQTPGEEGADIGDPEITWDLPELPEGTQRTAPLGLVAGARSGDKGGNANVGIWATHPDTASWLAHTLTVETFQHLVPETAGLEVTRHDLPNLRAVNFVIKGLLGTGVASATRPDPQAKGLAEFVRSRMLPIPLSVLPGET